MRLTHPSFYSEYKNLRKATYTNLRKRSITGKALKTNGKPIEGAMFVFTHSTDGEAESIVKYTKDKGMFYIEEIPEGVYNVTITKVGYITQQTTVAVDNIDMVTLTVTLVK